jgi:glutathione synthase/RimK-type ligase-like ATP-grasp enzyme
MDVRLGWLDRHPNSGAQIQGRIVPQWAEMRDLAERAHRAFDDRVVVGWDIAPTPDGPILVEGNGGPDFDIIQRTRRAGLANSRLTELLRYHLNEPAAVPAAA